MKEEKKITLQISKDGVKVWERRNDHILEDDGERFISQGGSYVGLNESNFLNIIAMIKDSIINLNGFYPRLCDTDESKENMKQAFIELNKVTSKISNSYE